MKTHSIFPDYIPLIDTAELYRRIAKEMRLLEIDDTLEGEDLLDDYDTLEGEDLLDDYDTLEGEDLLELAII